jgi:hypothetical protein
VEKKKKDCIVGRVLYKETKKKRKERKQKEKPSGNLKV